MRNKGVLLFFLFGIFTFVALAQEVEPEEGKVVKREASLQAEPRTKGKKEKDNKPIEGKKQEKNKESTKEQI